MVADAVAAFDAQTLARPTAIELQLEPGLVVAGDQPTLVRALANLLHNAWKYSGDDKQITVTARAVGRKVELAVADNGLGLCGKEHTEVFARFARGRAALERGTPGVGLGLAFVQAIARGHRGRIHASPRPGGGTIFTMRLPRARTRAASPVPTPEAVTT
ncbi:MAG: ATP-binding protein [Kofleriaceae bacterium]